MYSVLLTKETMLTRFQVARVALINRSNSLTILSIIGVVHFVYSLLGLLVIYSCEYNVFNHVASIRANSSRSIKTHSQKSAILTKKFLVQWPIQWPNGQPSWPHPLLGGLKPIMFNVKLVLILFNCYGFILKILCCVSLAIFRWTFNKLSFTLYAHEILYIIWNSPRGFARGLHKFTQNVCLLF